MKKYKLAKAVALAISGVALSAGAISTASAHVSYNTYNACAAIGSRRHRRLDDRPAAGWGLRAGAQPAARAAPRVAGRHRSDLLAS